MGNYIRELKAHIHLIASPDTWIEGKAIQQLETTAQLEGIQKAVGMPDLHPGRGYPVGAAFFSTDRIYPALVGNDIGCGMALWQTNIRASSFKLDKAQKQLGSIDMPLTEHSKQQLLPGANTQAPGTIGGGNHFAEIQRIDTIFDDPLAQKLELSEQHLQLLIHSGSRGKGEQILQSHIAQFNHSGLPYGSPEFYNYMHQHRDALFQAWENRFLIALRILERLKTHGTPVLDIFHNLITYTQVGAVHGWIHRKGAAPSDMGVIVIPGSRGDYSYIVKPTAKHNHVTTLHSLAHGAGRKWMRSDCASRLTRFSTEQLKRSALGSRLICSNSELVYEEAPQAYKPIINIIDALEGAGLITKVARLKPVLTYKTQKENK